MGEGDSYADQLSLASQGWSLELNVGLTLLTPHWLEEMWVLQGVEARGSGQGSKDVAVA